MRSDTGRATNIDNLVKSPKRTFYEVVNLGVAEKAPDMIKNDRGFLILAIRASVVPQK